MRRNVVRLMVVFSLLLFVAGMAVNAFAGWVQTEANGDVTYFSDGKVKSTSGEDDTWSVIDSATGALTMVSPGRKVFAVLTVDELCAFISKMMSGMTPEQKAMFEEMKKKKLSQGFKAKKVGPGGKVAGYSTDKYLITAGDSSTEVWVSTDSSLNRGYSKMMNKVRPLANKMATCSAMGGGAMEVENSKAYRKLEEKGWMLKTATKDGMVESSSETVKIEKKEIPASVFKVPSGYRKTSIEEIFGG